MGLWMDGWMDGKIGGDELILSLLRDDMMEMGEVMFWGLVRLSFLQCQLRFDDSFTVLMMEGEWQGHIDC